MKMTVRVGRKNGPAAVRTKLYRARTTDQNKVEDGLLAIGEYLLNESGKLCPKDTYVLVESGRVRKEGSGIKTVVTVGYGPLDHGTVTRFSPKLGQAVGRDPSYYAVLVHEDATQHHDPGQQAKFLEEPCLTKQDVMRRIFWAEMSK